MDPASIFLNHESPNTQVSSLKKVITTLFGMVTAILFFIQTEGQGILVNLSSGTKLQKCKK